MNSWCLTAAADFEIAPALEVIREHQSRAVPVAILGIGALSSAKAMSRAIDDVRGKDIVFFGTCGIFGPFTGARLVRVTRAMWLPPCVRHAIAYTVGGTDQPYNLPHPHAAFKDLPPATLVGSSTISLDPALPTSLPPLTYVENLELYSVAAELASVGHSFTAILGITNAIGPDAHAQWKANKDEASRLFAERLSRSLHTEPHP